MHWLDALTMVSKMLALSGFVVGILLLHQAHARALWRLQVLLTGLACLTIMLMGLDMGYEYFRLSLAHYSQARRLLTGVMLAACAWGFVVALLWGHDG